MKMNTSITGLVVTCLCLAVAGCSDSSDDDTPPSTATTSVGTITGFGSVIVNGVRFEDRGATVTVNDQNATTAQLKVGMVVAVDGSLKACPNADVALCEGVAERIRFRNNLEGPITTINRLTNTVQVMGREVVIDDSTAFDGIAAGDLSGLSADDVVAVSGLTEQNRVRARLVQRIGPFVNGSTPIMAHGLVSNVNTALGTCLVEGIQVRFQGLPAAALPAGGVADGQYVQVQGKGFGSGLMTADRIQLRDRVSFPDASLVELEGYIADFVSAASFTVQGQPVDASNAIFRNGTVADLANGAKVEVEGTISGAVLLARKLIFRLEASAQIVAPIQSKEDATDSLVLLGQSVATTPLTQFVDRSAGAGRPDRMLDYTALRPGDRVDVRAYKDSAGQLLATRVERTEADPLLIARGAVDAETAQTLLTVLGIDVATGPNTRYRDNLGTLISDVNFYDLVQAPPALPTVVRAQGVVSATNTNTTIDATRTTSTRGEVEIAQYTERGDLKP